jgi:hypothetical protein
LASERALRLKKCDATAPTLAKEATVGVDIDENRAGIEM